MNRGGAGLAASASSRLDTVGVLVGVAVVAMSGAVPGIGNCGKRARVPGMMIGIRG